MAAKKPPAIQHIYCPWCHAPLAFAGTLALTFAPDEKRDADRYDCAGPEPHTLLVMKRLND